MKNTLILAGSIVIAGVFIAGGIYLSKRQVPNTISGNTVNSQTIVVKPVTSTDHILGPKNAPITIIEYSDPECPFCKIFHATMISLMSDPSLQGKIDWVYRHFPLDSIHHKARYEAQALECAGLVGGNQAFWDMTNKLYEVTPSNDGLDDSTLPDMAASVGIDKAKFTQCLNSGQAAAIVEQEYQDAVAAGGTGTPYSIIIGPNGQKIPVNGAVPLDSLKTQIESLINLSN